ncbi:serine/threonine-protein kinase [Agitococcus lubricus]|uniref:non-specific serine/threonine protein kinase n=1 Tax=Agitococcus lubricus TaxID=1077255 RepID=A0A2T5IWG7_9GAMM|nr:serine/threonine-protein kinase [Agitococcus lubricus]PTQ88265.1 serine/threonine-protein kinase [Agitococcus lubricus]
MPKVTLSWKSDWFIGLVITSFMAVIAASPLIENLERNAYDMGVRSSHHEAGDKIAVIAIDDESISNIGRWPWPRSYLAEMVNGLNQGGAKAIGLPIFLSEPQVDPGLKSLRELNEFYAQQLAPMADNAAIGELGMKLAEAESALNTDQQLADSFANAKNVVLPMQFVLGAMQGHPDGELPAYVTRNQITNIQDDKDASSLGMTPPETNQAVPPVAQLGEQAAFIGHLTINPDNDGGIRTEPLLISYDGAYYPSLSLMLAAKSLNLKPEDIQLNLGDSLKLGKLDIKTDEFSQMRTFYYGDVDELSPFAIDSFYDVVSGKIPVSKYKDKIVIIGPTAYGLGSPQVTPISPAMEPVLILAHNVASILNQNFFLVPEWSPLLRWGLFLVAALYLMLLLPRLSAKHAVWASTTFVIALLSAHFVLMTNSGIWVPLMLPAALVVVGHILLTTKRYLVTEKAKVRSDEKSAESNRMLGLALQQQGQLDMAFEKFRQCPRDESILDVMYNLALDYERKRQFNKAISVYQYMADFAPEFRDLKEKLARAKKLEETVILGGSSSSASNSTMILDPHSDEKPMLGRYQVEKELGKGAMGVVYLGKDPKINRVVAIKTMALKEEFEADELEEVKERFFREAETAGRLNHPNIVTIYDAGEEHDLAYIAMEFLKGHDLARYTKADALLPVPKVINIIHKAALALDYAHEFNIVHRDIKPANIMFNPENSDIKITDFGIARITDSSKTKTGTVLGTPTYMSPEQLAGHKVDGRSDLYSLGVMFYQMLAGTPPFKAESMAALMFKITNEPHPPLFSKRPELEAQLPCIASVIDKALAKNVSERYQTGREFARAIKNCIESCGQKTG